MKYRLYYILRNKVYSKKYSTKLYAKEVTFLDFYEYYNPTSSYYNLEFDFLNKTKEFKEEIDWNFSDFGKLWTYNLNYFDFLNQPTLTKEKGLQLIHHHNSKNSELLDGLEAYPISLRSINWIKFLSRYEIKDNSINGYLISHYKRLCDNLEYHLLGNHLLENGFSLLWGSYFFKCKKLYKKAHKILLNELKEQILEDGAHFELSPMYHQIMLYRVLDCAYLIENNNWIKDNLLEFLKETANKMLSFLDNITLSNGDIPMLNDSTFGIAPSTKELFEFSTAIKLDKHKNLKLKQSGYRKIKGYNYELLVDIGEVGASYQPAHAHADTLSFVLYVNEKPFIVDRGISTYEKNNLRTLERSTLSHNTVMIEGKEQTDVWGGFRVGKRAKTNVVIDNSREIKATHDGYRNIGVIHQRTFVGLAESVKITDDILGNKMYQNLAFIHFHPNIKSIAIDKNRLRVLDSDITLAFQGASNISITEYEYCLGFNKTKKAKKAIIQFKDKLTSEIILT